MGIVRFLNKNLNIVVILLIFWSFFWMLNGFDKFFNGTMEPMVEPGLEKGVLVDSEGAETFSLYGYETNGLFGSNRNAKTVTFFERIGIAESFSLPLLYSVAVFEIGLGVMFLASLWQCFRKNSSFVECASLSYKLSIVLFTGFCAVDVLIGERIELWEHTTFIVALALSYGATHYFEKQEAVGRPFAAVRASESPIVKKVSMQV